MSGGRFCATSSFLSRAQWHGDTSIYRHLPAGVGVYLAQELTEFGAREVVERPIGVQFSGDLVWLIASACGADWRIG